MTEYDNKIISNLEKRVEKIEDKQNLMLQEIASFAPILKELSKNVEKIGQNTIDKKRIEDLEKKVENLSQNLQEKTTGKDAEKWNMAVRSIISVLISTILGFVIGIITK